MSAANSSKADQAFIFAVDSAVVNTHKPQTVLNSYVSLFGQIQIVTFTIRLNTNRTQIIAWLIVLQSRSHWEDRQLDLHVIQHFFVSGHHADAVMPFGGKGLQLELWQKVTDSNTTDSWGQLTIPFQNWNQCLSQQSWASRLLFTFGQTALFSPLWTDH